MKRTIIYADTGEVVVKGAMFFMVYTKRNFVLDTRLNLTDIRVFGYMCSIMLKDNHIVDTQARIAKRLGIKTSNLSRSIKVLRDYGYLEHSQYRGRKCLRVNPLYCSKRSSRQWEMESMCAEDGPEYN